jgi:hypothetical protein
MVGSTMAWLQPLLHSVYGALMQNISTSHYATNYKLQIHFH